MSAPGPPRARSTAAVVTDLRRERDGLVGALGDLEGSVASLVQPVLSGRKRVRAVAGRVTLGVGGVLSALILARALRRRR